MHLTKILVLTAPICSYGFTPIRNIVTGQAFTSSLLNNINQEFISENNVINDIVHYHLHPELDVIYTSVFAVTLYLQYIFYIEKKNWEDIELYSVYRKRFNMLLMVLFIVFAKNIDNAI
jgi:hypothetical protein